MSSKSLGGHLVGQLVAVRSNQQPPLLLLILLLLLVEITIFCGRRVDGAELGAITNPVLPIELAGTNARDDYEFLELSHKLDNMTIHWPSSPGFMREVIAEDQANLNSEYYLMDKFSTGVHCGTHLDAPKHFNQQGWTVDSIPIERLVEVPLHVVDLSAKVGLDRSYAFTKADFMDATGRRPLISKNSVVLVYTGISLHYSSGPAAYYGVGGADQLTNTSAMKIPGFSKEAAEFMVEMQVFGVGLDAPSADSSQQHDDSGKIHAIAHRILANANIYILENLDQGLSILLDNSRGISSSFRLTATPLLIVDGSGSPVRVVATKCNHHCGGKMYPSVAGAAFNPRPDAKSILLSMLLIVSMFVF